MDELTPKKNKGIFTYLLIIFIAIGCIYFVSTRLSKNADKKDYSEIMVEFDNYNVSEYEIDLGSGELTYKLRGDDKEHKYEVPNVGIFMDDIKNYRSIYNVKHPDQPLKENLIKITDRSWLYSLIPVIITVLLGRAHV